MFLFFDKEIITIVLDNLISNAIKYTEQGRVTLSLHQTMRNEVAYTEIKVSDTGYGISTEALPHIFDRYYQESGKHQASGTGIGLALVKISSPYMKGKSVQKVSKMREVRSISVY